VISKSILFRKIWWIVSGGFGGLNFWTIFYKGTDFVIGNLEIAYLLAPVHWACLSLLFFGKIPYVVFGSYRPCFAGHEEDHLLTYANARTVRNVLIFILEIKVCFSWGKRERSFM